MVSFIYLYANSYKFCKKGVLWHCFSCLYVSIITAKKNGCNWLVVIVTGRGNSWQTFSGVSLPLIQMTLLYLNQIQNSFSVCLWSFWSDKHDHSMIHNSQAFCCNHLATICVLLTIWWPFVCWWSFGDHWCVGKSSLILHLFYIY